MAPHRSTRSSQANKVTKKAHRRAKTVKHQTGHTVGTNGVTHHPVDLGNGMTAEMTIKRRLTAADRNGDQPTIPTGSPYKTYWFVVNDGFVRIETQEVFHAICDIIVKENPTHDEEKASSSTWFTSATNKWNQSTVKDFKKKIGLFHGKYTV